MITPLKINIKKYGLKFGTRLYYCEFKAGVIRFLDGDSTFVNFLPELFDRKFVWKLFSKIKPYNGFYRKINSKLKQNYDI